MNLTLTFMGQLRQLADKDCEVCVVDDGTSLVDVLKSVARTYGDRFGNMLFNESGDLRPSAMILVNGTPVDKSALPCLNDGDSITLLTAIAGG